MNKETLNLRRTVTAFTLHMVVLFPHAIWDQRQKYIQGAVSYQDYLLTALTGFILCYVFLQIIENWWLPEKRENEETK